MLERQKRKLAGPSAIGHLDIARMKAGGIKVQIFAVYEEPGRSQGVLRRVLESIDLFYREVSENAEEIAVARNLKEIEFALGKGKIAAILSIEGGEALEGSIGVLRIFYKLGVRCLTVTWNERNELGSGVFGGNGGLTPFGVKVIEEMNRLGMIIDVSHLNEEGFWEVLSLSKGPVIASHSNCRAVCEHSRNLSDEQIKALAKKGGVMGITFVPEFLRGEQSSLEDVLDHIEHAVNVGGEDCVGIGSDFDGTDHLPSGLRDCRDINRLVIGLLERGYSEVVIEKILGINFLRVIEKVLL